MTYLDIARGLKQPLTNTTDPYHANHTDPKDAAFSVSDQLPAPSTCAESAISAASLPSSSYPLGYAPLDDVIATDEATKHPRLAIVARVERLRVVAARDDATALDRAILTDWETILAQEETE